MMQFGANWCNLVQTGGTSSGLVQLGADWCTLVQLGAD